MDRDQILLSVREIRAVAEWLNAPECPYVLQKVPEDGVCLFRMLYDFTRECCRDGLVRLVEARKQQTAGGGRKEKKKNNDDTDNLGSFCKILAAGAVVSTERLQKELGKRAVEQSSRKALKRLAASDDPVALLQEGLWDELEAQHVLRAFVEMMRDEGDVVVVVRLFQMSVTLDGRDVVRQSEVHGDEEGANGNVPTLVAFKWNGLPHFDVFRFV